MPKKVEECVSSIMEDNPDMDESTAWAICNSQFKADVLLRLKRDLELDGSEFETAVKLLEDVESAED